MISFALGLPDLEVSPLRLSPPHTDFLTDDALQYSPPTERLRLQVAQLLEMRGIRCSQRHVFLSSGAQQGIRLAAELLLQPDRPVLTEEYTYPGLLYALAPMRASVVTVPTNSVSGIEVDSVEQLLLDGVRPSFLYVVPDGHNPTGTSMSLNSRHRLVELARRYRFPIVEDDTYGLLDFHTDALPPLRAMDDQWIVHIGSFSKILGPALRVGWIVAPTTLLGKLPAAKEGADLDVASVGQTLTCRFLATQDMRSHLATARARYRARSSVLLDALRRHMSADATWTTPRGGFFIWLHLGRSVDTSQLIGAALVNGVAFIPGQHFAARPAGHPVSSLRLSFSHCPLDRMDEGIARLAGLLQ